MGVKLKENVYEKGEDPKDLEIDQRKKLEDIQNKNLDEY